jgi:hypothetical protein
VAVAALCLSLTLLWLRLCADRWLLTFNTRLNKRALKPYQVQQQARSEIP